MAQNHYDVLENGSHPWLLQGHAHDHIHAKDRAAGFEAYGIKSQSFFEMNPAAVLQGRTRLGQRAKNNSNWAKNGPGMQAIFLGPKRKSCGTGVFIPRGQGNDVQFTNKPAFSPVLLPSRVIQALNLNVHELGQDIKPQSEQNKINDEVEKNELEIDENLEKEKEDYVSFSPEILLPKEWTY